MRRKSERNKAKASPEKKVEKPTRKSTRRRGKRSPSTSPDRDNSNDAATPLARDNENETTTSQPRLPTRECETISEIAESNVTSTETTAKQQDPSEDAGSVWKVARADASPGEIQKLKLCRQRNMSETSDASSSRKRSNKWQEGGEGTTEEIDSADERTTVGSSMTAVDSAQTTEEIASALPGRDSSEEVSDSKEFPPEIATAELSDDKPNIDDERHDDDETSETTIAITAIERVDDDNETETVEEPSGTLTTNVIGTNGEQNEEQIPKEETISAIVSVDKVDVPNADEEKASNVDKGKSDMKDSKESNSDDNENQNDEDGKKITEAVLKKTTAKKERSDTSEENTDDDRQEKSSRTSLPRTTSRRKHRDKYCDSSNSDTAESEEEPERNDDRGKRTEEVKKKTREDVKILTVVNEEKDISRTPETRPDTSIINNSPVDETKIIDNDKDKSKDEIERSDQVVTTAVPSIQSQTNYKPAKVNLKRSFSARPSVESTESKKDTIDNDASDLANQDKENHASSEQLDAKSIPKKRRWGTILASTDVAPAFSVSTDSLKVLVPGAKPLPINEVRLSKDDDEDRDRRNQREKRYSTSESGPDHKSREDGEKPKNAEVKKDAKGDNHIASRRKISIVKDTQHTKSPSPPAAIPTSILLIKNLVRPFTLNQIRELLSRTGTIVENGFWMDRIKSKCFVEYSNEDQAFETRQALHGISWPVSNPKRLQVEYAAKEDMELARELSKDQPISRKTEPLASNDGWQQDWARDEKTNSTVKVTVVREWDLGKEDGQHFTKEKEREKKDLDKKRRQRSRSPTMEAHLPAPARKFKKKEDDPPPAKLLDDLFRKTKATPCIYWLPLTNEQIVVKEEMRRQHMAEHARRLEEMRRAERNRDGRRRRSPRK